MAISPELIALVLMQLGALGAAWAHLLSRLVRVEAELRSVAEELRRVRNERAAERAHHVL